MDPWSTPSAKGITELQEKLKKGEEVYRRIEMNKTKEPARSALWELLFAVEKARDESPTDEIAWTKLSDVLPFVNAAYERMDHPLCDLAILKTMLSYCIERRVVNIKRCKKAGKIEEYIQPTDDFAAFKLYVTVAMPRVPPARGSSGPVPRPSSASKWWEQDAETACSSGFTKMSQQLAPVIASFWKGKKLMERITSSADLKANKNSILEFVHALFTIETKTPNHSAIHLYRITAQVAIDTAKYGSGAPPADNLQTIVSDAVRLGLITATTPFFYNSTVDASDLILFVLGEQDFAGLVIGAQVDKRFDAFFAKLAAEVVFG